VTFVTTTAIVVATTFASTSARAQSLNAPPPPEVAGVAVQEHLGAFVPLDVRFRDHAGDVVALSDLVRGKPVILNLMYHRCAMLCSVVLDALTASLTKIDWSAGDQFDVVTLSIDPHDTTTVAATKRSRILDKYGRPEAARGWTFLVGREPDIRKVADAVGFEYRWDADGDQWIHPAAIFVLTGDGRIARYLYGVDFAPRDLKFALLEASEGRTVSTYDRILLACYHWDPKGRTYRLAIPRITRIAAATILVVVAAGLAYLWRRERARGSNGA
jgi:protein SCO1/2